MRYLAVITLLVLALAQPAAARTFIPDFIVGWDAYEEKDYATALKNLRPLAKRGVADAQFYLGMMYYEGKGVPQDYAMAFRWLRKAALEGHASAQYILGWMYNNGQGVLQDNIMAYVWIDVAAANGKKDVTKGRDIVAEELDRSELKKTRKLSKLCFKRPTNCPEYSDVPMCYDYLDAYSRTNLIGTVNIRASTDDQLVYRWIDGYITAYNKHVDSGFKVILGGMTSNDTKRWLASWCREKNMSKALDQALQALMKKIYSEKEECNTKHSCKDDFGPIKK